MKLKILKHQIKTKFLTVNKIFIVAIASLSLYSCSSVKEYQKAKINDAEMVLTSKKNGKI